MFKLEDVKVRRRSWIKGAASPDTFRSNWLLEDCTAVEAEKLESVRKWISAAKDGKVIRNTESKLCGKGLLMFGPPGRGKTTLSVAIMNEVATTFPIEAFDPPESKVLIRPVYFISFDKFLALKSDMMNSPFPDQETLWYGILGECLDDAYNVRVLVIDDLGKEHAGPTGWQKTILHQLLRTRFSKGLPTIITTNIPLSGWGGLYGDATESFAREAFAYLTIDSDKGDLRQ